MRVLQSVCGQVTTAVAAMVAVAATSPPAAAREPAQKEVFGWIEEVMLDPKRGFKLQAKLDTGADTSSLDASDIRRVRSGDKRYVRFKIADPATGELVELKKPYVRRVRIKAHDGDYQRRVVVRMSLCIGDISRSIEVNLVDRGEFDYPMLLGRSALQEIGIVDPSIMLTREPVCWDFPDDLAATKADDPPLPAAP